MDGFGETVNLPKKGKRWVLVKVALTLKKAKTEDGIVGIVELL